MNTPRPSSSDGEQDEPIFSEEELRKLAGLVPTNPRPEQWNKLAERIREQTQPNPTPSIWHQEQWLWAVAAVAFGIIVGLVFFWQQPQPKPILERAKPEVASSALPELAPEPRVVENEPEYPLAQPGEVRFVSVKPVPGCCEPILPPLNCPNCPMVYASTTP